MGNKEIGVMTIAHRGGIAGAMSLVRGKVF
jgi:hypothetical protein